MSIHASLCYVFTKITRIYRSDFTCMDSEQFWCFHYGGNPHKPSDSVCLCVPVCVLKAMVIMDALPQQLRKISWNRNFLGISWSHWLFLYKLHHLVSCENEWNTSLYSDVQYQWLNNLSILDNLLNLVNEQPNPRATLESWTHWQNTALQACPEVTEISFRVEIHIENWEAQVTHETTIKTCSQRE